MRAVILRSISIVLFATVPYLVIAYVTNSSYSWKFNDSLVDNLTYGSVVVGVLSGIFLIVLNIKGLRLEKITKRSKKLRC